MITEEILEKQVEALEKLLQLKQAIISELEGKINKLEADKFNNPFQPLAPPHQPFQPYLQPNPIMVPSQWTVLDLCSDGCPHNYPFPWHSTSSPSCTKCGKYQPSWVITSSNSLPTTLTANAKEEDGADVRSLITAINK